MRDHPGLIGGVGLFLVFNVVRKLGGTVSARDRDSRGAEIEMRLPLASLAILDPEEDVDDDDAND